MQSLDLTEHPVTKPAAAKLANAWNESFPMLGSLACLHEILEGRDPDVEIPVRG
jgi:hypothetical protein